MLGEVKDEVRFDGVQGSSHASRVGQVDVVALDPAPDVRKPPGVGLAAHEQVNDGIAGEKGADEVGADETACPRDDRAQTGERHSSDVGGHDRGLKRLALTTLSQLELSPPNGNLGPTVTAETTLRDALSLMLTEGARELRVVDADGSPRGTLSLDHVTELLR